MEGRREGRREEGDHGVNVPGFDPCSKRRREGGREGGREGRREGGVPALLTRAKSWPSFSLPILSTAASMSPALVTSRGSRVRMPVVGRRKGEREEEREGGGVVSQSLIHI